MSRDAESIFHEARALSGAERVAYLDGACGADASLRLRVEALLEAHDDAGSFLRTAESLGGAGAAVSESEGDTIGRYRLLQRIGQGGFGVVYMAEQTEPVRRRVALKIIKLGMDTKQVIARFEAERQALALMDHPNIAKVLDAGATETGRPYFVMELVKGESITAYCDKQSLTVEDRLALFGRVCGAVQHAHQKGIIHRDIKPSNVMITLHDGVPVPKVIDFGIAKATNARLTEKTVFTEYRQLIGTPEYMSPEQAEMSGIDIDTRSDVYSLGVLLYELLTGVTPFDGRKLRSAGYGEIQRIIREETPQKPSTRLSALETLPSVAAQRHTEPKRLGALIRGDLDWIVMRCLEKDRTRRYETSSGLAEDIRRYLEDEPVAAGPPSASYRLRKFVRRHRAGVGTIAVAGGAILVGLLLAGIGFVRAHGANQALQSQLWESLLTEARATRIGTRPGRRFESLEAIAEAASIRPSPELRNEMIASLALDDVRFDRAWPGRLYASVRGLEQIDRFAYMHAPGDVRIASIDDARELGRVTGSAKDSYPGPFSLTGRFLAVRFGQQGTSPLTIFDTLNGTPIIALQEGELIQGLIAFGATGGREWVVVGKRPGVMSVHELPTGEERFSVPFVGNQGFAAVDPAGERIAVANPQHDFIAILDADSGDRIWSIDTRKGASCVAFSGDGKYLGAANGHTIAVWNLEEGDYPTFLSGHKSQVTNLDFAAHGPILASSGWDNAIRIWNVENASLVIGPIDNWRLLGFGRRMVGASRDRVGVWSFEHSSAVTDILSRAAFGTFADIAIDPHGELVAISGHLGVGLWDVRTGLQRVALTDAASTSVTFSNDGSRVIASLEDGQHVWNLDRDEGPVRAGRMNILSRHEGKWISLSPDGTTLVLSGLSGVHLTRLDDGAVLGFLEAYRGMDGTPSVTPDGRFVFTGAWHGEAGQVREVATGRVLVQKEGVHVVGAFSPDGELLVVGTGSEYSCFDTSDWTLRWSVARDNADNLAGVLGFSGDSTLLAVSRSRYVLDLLDPNTGRTLASIESPGHEEIREVDLSADGGLLGIVTKVDRASLLDLARIRSRLDELGLDW